MTAMTAPAPARRLIASAQDHPVLVAAVAAVALFLVGGLASPGFVSVDRATSIAMSASFLAIIGAGQTLVVILGGGGVDLSVGAVATVGASLASIVMDGSDDAIVAGLLTGIAFGALVGLVNGLGVVLLRLPPLVMTLASGGVVSGLLLAVTNGQPRGRSAPGWTTLVNSRNLLGVPGAVFFAAGTLVVVSVLLSRTALGRSIYLTGSNAATARLSGTAISRVTLSTYVLSGVFAAFGGCLLLGFTQSVYLNLGDSYVLPTVAAVVIGGTALIGGVGSYAGTVIGAVILTTLDALMTVLKTGQAGRNIAFGVILLILLTAYGRQRRLRV